MKSSRSGRLAKPMTIVAIAAMMVTFVSYGTASGAPKASKASVVNITWETMWSGATLTLLNEMTTAFNKTHPGIHVTGVEHPERDRGCEALVPDCRR